MHLGYEVLDLMRAGFIETELMGKEGVTDAMLLGARDAIVHELHQKKGKVNFGDARILGRGASKVGDARIVGSTRSRRQSRGASKVAPDHQARD